MSTHQPTAADRYGDDMNVQFPKPGPPLGRPDEQARPAPGEPNAGQAPVEVPEESDASDVFEADASTPVEDYADETEDQSAAGDAEDHAPAATTHTGNHAVDRVLDSLDTLADKPVDEHVAVFEQAHEQLRGALDGPRLPRP
ncbi:hypothetical protein ASD66_22320 [Nocardioides sp. Root151]|nr:hypothetical protein ASD66_22320 [Nocardioides sp. Root151]